MKKSFLLIFSLCISMMTQANTFAFIKISTAGTLSDSLTKYMKYDNGSLYLRSLILTRCRHYCTLNDTNCHCGIPVADFIKSVLN
jgi:hypothetical protein